jgi:hypothetical protein
MARLLSEPLRPTEANKKFLVSCINLPDIGFHYSLSRGAAVKKYLLVLLVFVFLPACSQVKTQRQVYENTLYSSRPSLAVKISQKYKYLGELDYSGQSIGGHHNQYVFVLPKGNTVNKIMSNTANKIMIIWFGESPGAFRSNLFDDWSNKLEHGIRDLGGEKYQYVTSVGSPSAGLEVFRYLNEQQLLVPACTLMKIAARVYDSRGKRIVIFWYLEDVSDSGYLCSEWENVDSLTIDQVNYIKQFNANFDSAFTVISR